jgi:hypothetical protein
MLWIKEHKPLDDITQGVYTSKDQNIHDLFRVSLAFFLKFHYIFVNYGYSEVITTMWSTKATCIYCNYTASEIAIGSAWTGVYSWVLYCLPLPWTVYTVIPNTFLGHVGREGPSNWGEKNKINAK